MKLAFCIPVFNDWPSAQKLLVQIDEACSQIDAQAEVLFVDDASTEPVMTALDHAPAHLVKVSILGLRRNLSHQRAIAIGLTHLFATRDPDAVVVMDADGEDRPSDVPALLARCQAEQMSKVVFAGRAKRSEGSAFRFGYIAYRLLYRLLVGRPMRVGNFSVVPRRVLGRLVSVEELWNHYAASIFVARLPHVQVPTNRGRRIAGQSKMNIVSLVVHGLSAISVHGETVAVRILFLVGVITALLLLGLGAVVSIRLGTQLAIPGWATTSFGFILSALLDLTMISAIVAIFVMRGRSGQGFIPIRDYVHFKNDEQQVFAKES